MAAISAAKKKCIVLALDSEDDKTGYDELSPIVARGFLDDKVGRTIPFAVIASPDQTVRYAELSYKDLSAKVKAPKAIDSAVEKMETIKSSIPDNATKLTLFLNGKSFINIYITDVISETQFKYSRQPDKTNGKIYSTEGKSEGIKRFAKRIMEIKSEEVNAKREEMAKELMPKFQLELWTNTEGKAIKATFVSLAGENITLAMPSKSKPVTFALAKLNTASQSRAKELAAKVAEAEEKIKELK